ncbi:MAG: GNAT family N-acetyltransferase [Brevinematales bacterium]|nr:GNAT family N-acetyltransferase [Brevinematales bacterium]
MKALPQNMISAASAVFARAFLHDPLYAWFFPSHKNRLKKITQLYRFILNAHIRHVWISSDLLEGIALWETPYDHGMNVSPSLFLQAFNLLLSLGVVALAKMIFFAFSAFSLSKRLVPEEAFFLAGIVVDPPCQGKGVGKTMIQYLLQEADKKQKPVYLETQNPANIPYYEHFGFEVIEDRKIGPLDHVVMKRDFLPHRQNHQKKQAF